MVVYKHRFNPVYAHDDCTMFFPSFCCRFLFLYSLSRLLNILLLDGGILQTGREIASQHSSPFKITEDKGKVLYERNTNGLISSNFCVSVHDNVAGLVQDCIISVVNALEILQSCINHRYGMKTFPAMGKRVSCSDLCFTLVVAVLCRISCYTGLCYSRNQWHKHVIHGNLITPLLQN